mmetsp:Transcript_14278/g.17744  ORF Transcript_14278/g.17744 Transcript_14278/m.17744 type:complete len:381 (-) Transcript_14278:2243-3385(-)
MDVVPELNAVEGMNFVQRLMKGGDDKKSVEINNVLHVNMPIEDGRNVVDGLLVFLSKRRNVGAVILTENKKEIIWHNLDSLLCSKYEAQIDLGTQIEELATTTKAAIFLTNVFIRQPLLMTSANYGKTMMVIKQEYRLLLRYKNIDTKEIIIIFEIKSQDVSTSFEQSILNDNRLNHHVNSLNLLGAMYLEERNLDAVAQVEEEVRALLSGLELNDDDKNKYEDFHELSLKRLIAHAELRVVTPNIALNEAKVKFLSDSGNYLSYSLVRSRIMLPLLDIAALHGVDGNAVLTIDDHDLEFNFRVSLMRCQKIQGLCLASSVAGQSLAQRILSLECSLAKLGLALKWRTIYTCDEDSNSEIIEAKVILQGACLFFFGKICQ